MRRENPAGDKLTSTFATCLGKIHLSDLAQPAKQNVCTNVENYDSSVPAFNKSYVGWMHPGAPVIGGLPRRSRGTHNRGAESGTGAITSALSNV
jgi:hypothetical protein